MTASIIRMVLDTFFVVTLLSTIQFLRSYDRHPGFLVPCVKALQTVAFVSLFIHLHEKKTYQIPAVNTFTS